MVMVEMDFKEDGRDVGCFGCLRKAAPTHRRTPRTCHSDSDFTSVEFRDN